MTEEYSFGECKFCKRVLPLKDGVCIDCNNKSKEIDMPDIFNDIFNNFGL